MRVATAPHRLLSALLSMVLLAAFASLAGAQSWSEVGDAGNTWGTVQTPLGLGPLTQITGTLSDGSDVDAYCIEILSPTVFGASIQCGSHTDPSLWLFHFSGLGILHNDRCLGGLKDFPVGSVASVGTYFITVGPQGVQAQSSSGAMWQTGLFTGPRAPDGPGAGNNLNGWAGSGPVTFFSNYTITLRGASYCGTVVPTRPSAWGTIKLLYR